jgi:hypothetical protein
MEGKKRKSHQEVVRQVINSPQFRALQEERYLELKDHIEALRNAEAPLLAELAEAGFDVDTVQDLYQRRYDYRAAIPILLKWLPRVEYPTAKTLIARALEDRWARPQAAKPLIREFRKITDTTESDVSVLKDAIACALEVVADDSVFDDIVELVHDVTHHDRSGPLVASLGRMKDPRAVDVLIELLGDETLTVWALIGLRRLAPEGCRAHVEPFLASSNRAWRNEAKKLIAKLDKLKEKQSRGK